MDIAMCLYYQLKNLEECTPFLCYAREHFEFLVDNDKSYQPLIETLDRLEAVIIGAMADLQEQPSTQIVLKNSASGQNGQTQLIQFSIGDESAQPKYLLCDCGKCVNRLKFIQSSAIFYRENSPFLSKTAFIQMSKIIGNIFTHRDQVKFRSIPVLNPVFQKRIGSLIGGEGLMREMGFIRALQTVDKNEPPREILFLNESSLSDGTLEFSRRVLDFVVNLVAEKEWNSGDCKWFLQNVQSVFLGSK
jgi:hypothetical protein